MCRREWVDYVFEKRAAKNKPEMATQSRMIRKKGRTADVGDQVDICSVLDIHTDNLSVLEKRPPSGPLSSDDVRSDVPLFRPDMADRAIDTKLCQRIREAAGENGDALFRSCDLLQRRGITYAIC